MQGMRVTWTRSLNRTRLELSFQVQIEYASSVHALGALKDFLEKVMCPRMSEKPSYRFEPSKFRRPDVFMLFRSTLPTRRLKLKMTLAIEIYAREYLYIGIIIGVIHGSKKSGSCEEAQHGTTGYRYGEVQISAIQV